MHEVAAMRGAVATALERMRAAGATRVSEVHLVLGASGHLTEEAARQHFATFAAGTPAERARLTFTWLPATYRCFGCLRIFESTAPAASVECPTCGAVALEIAHDDTCAVGYIDVANDAAAGGAVDGGAVDVASRETGGMTCADAPIGPQVAATDDAPERWAR